MEVKTEEKTKKKVAIANIYPQSSILTSVPQEPMVSPMNPEQEKLLLEDLLGNVSDQTGACFG